MIGCCCCKCVADNPPDPTFIICGTVVIVTVFVLLGIVAWATVRDC